MDDFAEQGYRIYRNLLPHALVAEARDCLAAMLRAIHPDIDADSLDALATKTAQAYRADLGAIYDAFRETVVFRQMITDSALVQAASALLGTERLHSPFQHAVFRLDMPGEDWHTFSWHQDFPYNTLSNDYVTAWMPLTSTGPHNGSIDVVPGSHRQLYPVQVTHKRDAAGNKRATRDAFIAPAFRERFEAACIKPELEPGDVILFHNALVHRSGRITGNSNRFSVQARFGNLLAEEMAARRFVNRRRDGFEVFQGLHPELIEFIETEGER